MLKDAMATAFSGIKKYGWGGRGFRGDTGFNLYGLKPLNIVDFLWKLLDY